MVPNTDATTGHEPLRGAALVVLGAVAYGLLATVVRLAYARGFSPGQVVGAQMGFGCVGLWMLAFGLRTVKRLEARVVLGLLIAGIPTGLTGAFYYGAVHELGSASLAIVLLFQFTWMGVLLDAALARRRPTSDEVASLTVLFVGTILATGVVEGSLRALAPIGFVLGLASAASYAAVIFVSGRVALEVDAWYRSALLGTGSMLTVFALHPPRFLVDGSLAHGLLGPSFATALLGPIVPTICFAIGVPRIGASLASILGAVELPAAMIAARLILGEPTSALQWLGMLVILAGIALPRLRSLRAAPR